ncbi:MAG: tail fiber domain-containing protein [Clostridia bacterium]|nr:tail fiber domain-containing protein [Clostridia bacterium]
MNGKEINLTSDDITIQSNKLNVDKQGNLTCSNANIIGGEINLSSSSDDIPKFTVTSTSGTKMQISSGAILGYNNSGNLKIKVWSNLGAISMYDTNSNIYTNYTHGAITCRDNFDITSNGKTSINADSIEAKVNGYFRVINSSNNEIIAFGDTGIFPHRTIDMQGENIINAGNVSSDRRLKKDIQETEISAIDRIMQIQHKQFAWKKDNTKEEIGYIAQELEQIDPNYVRHNIIKDEDGNITSDNYEVRILPLLSTATKAIQEQQKIIEELKNRIEKLESDFKG